MHSHSNLYLSIGSFIGSLFSYLVAFVTDYHIMGIIGFIGLMVSIYAGILTIKEKRMSIKYMETDKLPGEVIKAENWLKRVLKHKSGGHR